MKLHTLLYWHSYFHQVFIVLLKLAVAVTSAPFEGLKSTWGEELAVSMSDDIWDWVLTLVNSTSLCVHHSLLQFKVVHRAHLSKSKLSKIYPDLDPRCNRCRSDDANPIIPTCFGPALPSHIFGRSFFCTLNKATDLKLALNPLFALFATVGEDDKYISGAKCHLLSSGSLSVRRAILVRWKAAAPPTHVQWLADLMSCLSPEKIHCSIQNHGGKFDQIWGLFLTNYP